MKIIRLFAICFCLAAVSFSAKAQVEPLSLASTMKSMGNKFKLLASQMNNPSLNASSAQLAEEIATGATASKTYEPDTIAGLPASEKATQKARYEQMLDETAKLLTDLAKALRANDNAQAKILFDQISQHKKDGHSEFKD